jgi:hypothetical protein
LKLRLGLCVACQHEFASVGCRQIDIDHLDGSELLQGTSGSEPRRQSMKAALQGNMQAICQKRDEDVGLDAVLVLVENRTYREVALQGLECLFDGDKLDVILPQQGRIIPGQVRAQQIASLAATLNFLRLRV